MNDDATPGDDAPPLQRKSANSRTYALLASLIASRTLPSLEEFRLMPSLGAPRAAIRAALRHLADDKVVTRKVREGTHASEPGWRLTAEPYRADSGDDGFLRRTPGATAEVLRVQLVSAPPVVADKLQLTREAQLILTVDKLWRVETQPLCLVHHWIPLDTVSESEVSRSTVAAAVEDPFRFALDRRSVGGGRVENKIIAATADDELASLLQVTAGSGLWEHDEFVVDRSGRPALWAQYLYVPQQLVISFRHDFV